MRFTAMVIALLGAVSAHAADLVVKESYYRETNASVHLFLENRGKEPITLLPPVVNGFDTTSLAKGCRKGDPVLWFHCRPNPIPAGGMADLIVTLADPATKPVSIELRASTGLRITRTVGAVPEKLRFQAVRFSEDLRTVDLYVRWADASSSDALRAIRMDGRDMAKRISMRSAHAQDGLAYARITLPEPIVAGSFHVFQAETKAGLSTAYQIRAIPAEFLIGVYGVPSPANIKDWADHGCNHYLSFGSVSPEQADLMHAQGISVGAKYVAQHLVDREAGKVVPYDEAASRSALQAVKAKPNLLYHHLVDEPDVADYYVERTLGASSMELAARYDFFERRDPERYAFIQLDNTFRPNNYRVYGEAADVAATHRYSLGCSINSEAGEKTSSRLAFFEDLVDTTGRMRMATEPRPFFMVPQFFDLGPGRAGRPPVVDEMRMQCYIMIAGGARGVIHYIHSGSSGGHEGAKTKPLWDGMTGLHAELMRMADVTSVGTPAPSAWVKADSAHILPTLILAGDRMGLVLLNRSHRSSLTTFVARPVRDVEVSVRIPSWIGARRFEVIPAGGGERITADARDGEITVTLGAVNVADGFVIEAKD